MQNTGSSFFQIKEKYYLSKNKADARNIESTEEQIPIYKIEFTSETGTGMAVVSGDRRAPHILAYIDNIKENQVFLCTYSFIILLRLIHSLR